MSRLFLRFHDDSFDGFDWCIVDAEAPVTHLSWRNSSESELKALLSEHVMPTVVVIPQQLVYLTEFELPEKASRQILASIEFQIEDQLAQDTELQHYALGEQRDNKVPIAVVEQAVMQSCQSLIEKYGIRVVQIIPELFLCPWFDGEGDVSLIECQQGVILRYGEYQGLKCKLDVLNSMLNLVNRQTPITQVNCFIDDELAIDALNISKYESNAKPLNTTSLDLEKISTINLQQRQFQASSNWLKMLDVWKSVAAVILVIFVVTGFNRVVALQDMEAELDAIRASQYELVKEYVGPRVTKSANLKKELIKLLQENSDGQKGADFISLLLDFSQARAAFESIQIVKISYQKLRLSVDISSQKLNDVEALHAALNAKGLSAKLEKLNIKPELISGQFILEAGNNG